MKVKKIKGKNMFKKLQTIIALAFLSTPAFAKNEIKIYYLETCPHCHHALEFIKGDLKKEYQFDLNEINVGIKENQKKFFETAKKCDLKSNGVPVMVINDHCIQGFGEPVKNVIKNYLSKEESNSETTKTTEQKIEEPATEQIEQNNKESANTRLSTLNKLILFCVFFGLGYLGVYLWKTKRKK